VNGVNSAALPNSISSGFGPLGSIVPIASGRFASPGVSSASNGASIEMIALPIACRPI